MLKVAYFTPDFVSEHEEWPCDYTNEDIKLLLADETPGVVLYDNIQLLVDGFNNEAISDLGYLRTVEVRTDLQIFKEGGEVSEEEKAIIKEYCQSPVIRDDKANGIIAYSLGERNSQHVVFILREGDEIVNKLNEIDDRWFVGNQFEEYVFID